MTRFKNLAIFLAICCCSVGLGNKLPQQPKPSCSGTACPSKVHRSHSPNSGSMRLPKVMPTPSHAPGGSQRPPGASMNRPHPSPARSHSGPHASQYPRPSMHPQGSGKLEPKKFLAMFYRHFYNAVHIAMKQRQEKGMGASMRTMPTPHLPKKAASAGVMPSPQSPKQDVPQVQNLLNMEIDAIFGLLASDFLGKRFTGGSAFDSRAPFNMLMKSQQTFGIKPTPAPGQKMSHGLKPSPSGSKPDNGRQESANAASQELKMFRSMIKQGLHGRKQCLNDLLLRGNVDVKNNTMYDRYVERHMQNITVVYFKFVKWITKVKQEMPCNKDCENIERMVAFCKNQYKACGGSMPKGSISIMPTPAGASANKCPKGQKMCPMRQECVPERTHCIDSRILFAAGTRKASMSSAMPGGHSVRKPHASPMPPRKSAGMGSKAWNLKPTPSAMPRMNFNDTLNRTVFAMAFKAAAKRNPNLDHKELVRLYKFMQGALGGKGMWNGNGSTAPDSKPEDKQPHVACINMCPKKNMTYCWPEMKCKPRGAHCNLMHLAAMMNTSTFENMTKCRGSFYCPVTGNCTKDAKSCDPSNSRLFDQVRRNETCLTPDMAKPANISREMAEMFGLRCKPTKKYCPGKYGCVDEKVNCTRSKDLRVMLKKDDEHEKKVFCRIRDLICPRVYFKWVNMKRSCPEQIKPKTDERPYPSLPPWVKPTKSHVKPTKSHVRSTKLPVHTNGGKPHPTKVKPRPTSQVPTATSGQPTPSSMPSGPKLKSVTLDVGRSLRLQMGLPTLVRFIAVVAVTDCPVSWKYITMSIRQGAPLKIPKKTNALKMKAPVVPLDAVIKYEVKDKHFHGVCILRYYKYSPARGARPSAPMPVDVDDSMSSGDLFLVVLPKAPPCDAQLFGRDFVEILEDTKKPPVFKLRDFIRMRNDSGPVVSRIPSAVRSALDKDIVDKYERIVQASQGGKCHIAILRYEGIPWSDGTWKSKGQIGALRNFPTTTSKLRPFIMSCNTSVTFYPRQDFDGKVCLFIRGACGEMVNGKEKFQLGDRAIKFCIHVKGQPDPPKMTTTFSCLTPLPYLMPTNKGFSIGDILKFGKMSCGNTGPQGARGEPLVAGLPTGKEINIGIAVIAASMPKDIGEWQTKAGSGAFSPLTKNTFKDGKAVCLNATSLLRFKPKNTTTLWGVAAAMQSVWVRILLWRPRHANATGLCNTTDMSNGLFSPVSKPIKLSLQRKGCDGVPGSGKKPDLCGKCGEKKFSNVKCACDERPNSDAVIDDCGKCSGGATGRVFHKRDCAGMCYANGTLSKNFLDSCGICQVRKYARKQARDCNNVCSSGRRRACTNKCGICVGGNTRKALNDGINNCGGCTANASSICVRKLTMVSAAKVGANEKFTLNVRSTGILSLRKLKCFVQKTGGALIEIGDGNSSPIKRVRPTVIDEDKCSDEPSTEYQVRIQPTIRDAGRYTVTCKVDSEASAMSVDGGSLDVISSSGISITGYHPKSIPTGKNVTVIIMGTGFTNTPGAICRASCEKSKPGTKDCMMETAARFINATAIECAFLSTMQAQEINLHLLPSTAVTEPRFSSARPVIVVRCPFPRAISAKFTSGIRRIKIALTGVVSLAPGIRPGCSSLFDSNTVQKFGTAVFCIVRNKEIYIFFLSPSPRIVAEAIGNRVRIGFSNNNLRCRGQKFSLAGSGSIQNLEIPLPTANVKAVISHGGDTLGTCDQMKFYGYKSKGGEGGRLHYFWELFKGATSQGPNKTRSWFKVDGKKLDPNAVYTCKLCVQNMFRQSDCTTKTFRTLDNQNSSLILRITGGEKRILKAARSYRMRPHVKISECGKAAKIVTTLRYIWELKAKDASDDATLKNNDRRDLKIKSGDLTPGKNYTLKLLVTDEKDSTLTAEAAVEVSVTGSPLQARIRGGKEMTVGCNGEAVFDARTSRDPDSTKTAARVTWECTEESGRPCFKTSDPTKRVMLEEKDRVSLAVNGSLECNKVYIFKMTYSKDSRSSSTSIRLTTKQGSPADCKLDYKKYGKKFLIVGYMRSKSAANATWKCVEEQGFDSLDLTDKTFVRAVGALSIKANRRQRHIARRPMLIIFTKDLPAGTKYKIQLEVTNEDGVSTAETIVSPPSPPVKGEVTIEPAEGEALNTSFTISGGVGWGNEGEDLRYEIGYEEKTRRGKKETIIKPFSEDNVLEDVKLPPGLDDENSTLSVYVKAKNADGLTSKTTKKIRCRKPRRISSTEVTDFMARSKKAFEEGNIEEANRILNTLAGTVNNAEVNGSTVNEEMTTQTVSILEQATDDTRPGILSTLRSTTKPSSGGAGLQGGTKDKVAQGLSKIFAPEKITQSASKRKRRSVGVTVTETFTPKTTEEVDSSMEVFDNIIDETEVSNFQDNMKKNFTDTVPSLLRSLCAGLVSSDEYLIAKNNLSTIRSNRLTAATFDTTSVNITDGSATSKLLLGSELRGTYENWNCSNSGLLCTELCVGTVLYHHNMYPGQFSGRVSDIADTILVHPETYALETPASLTTGMQYDLALNEIPDSQHTIECRTWNAAGSNWTTNGCVTTYSAGASVVCNCTTFDSVAAFKVQKPIITTLFPPVTTNATSVQSSTGVNGSSSAGITPTQSSSTSTGQRDSQNAVVVTFKFNVDYNTYAYGSKYSTLKQSIIDMLVQKLNISASRIVNLEMKSGSIIVTFTLLNNSGYSNEGNVVNIQALITSLAQNGSLVVTLHDGTTVAVDAASLVFAPPTTTMPPKPHPKPKKKDHVVIIIVVVVAVLVAIIVLVLIRYYMIQRSRKTKMDDGRTQSSTMLVIDNIKLQDRQRTPESDTTYNNQAYEKSPTFAHRKDPSPPPAYEKPKTPSTPPRYEKPRTPTTPLPEKPSTPGGTVTAGIGSSVSVRDKYFNS